MHSIHEIHFQFTAHCSAVLCGTLALWGFPQWFFTSLSFALFLFLPHALYRHLFHFHLLSLWPSSNSGLRLNGSDCGSREALHNEGGYVKKMVRKKTWTKIYAYASDTAYEKLWYRVENRIGKSKENLWEAKAARAGKLLSTLLHWLAAESGKTWLKVVEHATRRT